MGKCRKWTDADAQALLELVKAHGADWALIAKSLPGSRSTTSVSQKHTKLTMPKEKRDQLLLHRREQVKDLSAEELEKKRSKRRVANLSAEELEKKRRRDRDRNLSTEALEKKRSKQRVANLSAEELEKKRSKRRVANLSAEELEKKRSGDRVANLSTERLEKKRKVERESKAKKTAARKTPSGLAAAAQSDRTKQVRQLILNTSSGSTCTCECQDEGCICRRRATQESLLLSRTGLPENWSCGQKAVRLDHVEGDQRAGIGKEGYDLSECIPLCVEVGGCSAVTKTLERVGSLNQDPAKLPQLLSKALLPSTLIAKASSATNDDISVVQCHAHCCCRMRMVCSMCDDWATFRGRTSYSNYTQAEIDAEFVRQFESSELPSLPPAEIGRHDAKQQRRAEPPPFPPSTD